MDSPQLLGEPHCQVTPSYGYVSFPEASRANTTPSFLIDVCTKLSIPLFDDDDDETISSYHIGDSVEFWQVFSLPAETMIKHDNTEARAALVAFLTAVHVPPSLISSLTDQIISCGRTMWNNRHPNFRVFRVKVDVDVYVDLLPFDDDDEEEDQNAAVNFCFVSASKEAIESLERVIVDSDQVDRISCSVCLEDVLVGSEATKLPCCHLYHGDCIVKWLQNSKYCPLCRFEMPT